MRMGLCMTSNMLCLLGAVLPPPSAPQGRGAGGVNAMVTDITDDGYTVAWGAVGVPLVTRRRQLRTGPQGRGGP
jgi:hypothetical protein